MPINFSFDDDGLVMEQNNWVLVAGVEACRQRLIANLKAVQGEWFLDPTLGVPYFGQVFARKKGVDVGTLSTVFRDVILNTEGVKAIQTLTLDYDAASRRLTVTFRVDVTDGTIEETITTGV